MYVCWTNTRYSQPHNMSDIIYIYCIAWYCMGTSKVDRSTDWLALTKNALYNIIIHDVFARTCELRRRRIHTKRLKRSSRKGFITTRTPAGPSCRPCIIYIRVSIVTGLIFFFRCFVSPICKCQVGTKWRSEKELYYIVNAPPQILPPPPLTPNRFHSL